MLNPQRGRACSAGVPEEQIGKLLSNFLPSEGDFSIVIVRDPSGETPASWRPVPSSCRGRERHLRTLSAAAMRSAQRAIAGVIALLLDVTERREAEEKTRAPRLRVGKPLRELARKCHSSTGRPCVIARFNQRHQKKLATPGGVRPPQGERVPGRVDCGRACGRICARSCERAAPRWSCAFGPSPARSGQRSSTPGASSSPARPTSSMRQDVTETLRGQAHERLRARGRG